jgi:fatty acid-binding protein DegV
MRNFVIMNGESLEDGVDITREDIYKRIPQMKEPPTTATASSGAYEELYQRVFDEGAEHILSIHPSIQLSGILNVQQRTRLPRHSTGRVHVLDSQTITMGLGPQVLRRLAILHTNAEEEARALLDHIDFDVPETPFFVNVTTIIGTHVGPNCLGFACMTA